MWDVSDKGFFPVSDPISSIPIHDIKNTELVYTWENISNVLPYYLKEECLREELIYDLRTVSKSYYHGFIDNLGGVSSYERTFFLMAYFATAYINSPEGKQKTKLPKEITIPFVRASHLVGRHPVINYTSFVLYNWRKKDKNAGLNKNNIEIIHTFTDLHSEKSVLKAIVEMECINIDLISNLANPFYVLEKLVKINYVLNKAWEETTVEFLDYWDKILLDCKKIRYEQWRPDDLVFLCDIFLQSPLLFVLYRYLNISFNNECVRKRNEELLHLHMPLAHRKFIGSVNGIRNKCIEKTFKEVYNNCLDQLIKLHRQLSFRTVDKTVNIVVTNELNEYYL